MNKALYLGFVLTMMMFLNSCLFTGLYQRKKKFVMQIAHPVINGKNTLSPWQSIRTQTRNDSDRYKQLDAIAHCQHFNFGLLAKFAKSTCKTRKFKVQ